ncbi:MAG: pitrilysin family protein [Alphaproteobacteria bacterium]
MKRLVPVLVALLLAWPAAAAVPVERVVSPGGIEAWLVEDHSLPVISLRFAFKGGAALDPADKGGLASFATVLLDEGAGPLDSQAFQARLEELAVDLGFSAGPDEVTGELRTLSANRAAAFDLLRLALTDPRFESDVVERKRAEIIARLRQRAQDPDVIASRGWYRAMLGDHPYSRPAEGTPETISDITVEDLRALVKDRFARENLMIAVAGDITPAELGGLLDETFGALRERPAAGDVPRASISEDGGALVVRRDRPQSVVIFGHRGIARDDPDFYAAYVLNYILGGGGFAARLMEEVREKRGLAYGISTYLVPLDQAPLMIGNVATENARVAETIAIIREEWEKLQSGGVTESERADAITYLTGSFPLRLTSTGKIADMVLMMQRNDLGIDYMDRRNALIEGVSLADLQRVAKRLLAPGALTFVVAGEPENLDDAQSLALPSAPE